MSWNDTLKVIACFATSSIRLEVLRALSSRQIIGTYDTRVYLLRIFELFSEDLRLDVLRDLEQNGLEGVWGKDIARVILEKIPQRNGALVIIGNHMIHREFLELQL